MTELHRLYTDVAPWWPLLSPVDEYVDEATEAARLLRTARRQVRSVLELGSGGGHVATHLSDAFDMTLVDLSEAMLLVSRRHNPRCTHQVGDMRTVRLGRTFDAVFVHDAIDYMRTRDDLEAALCTAFVHCRPGGAVVLMPDDTTETFAPSTEHGGSDATDGRGAPYLEWTWDPDPADSWVQTEYVFLLRTRTARSGRSTTRTTPDCFHAPPGWRSSATSASRHASSPSGRSTAGHPVTSTSAIVGVDLSPTAYIISDMVDDQRDGLGSMARDDGGARSVFPGFGDLTPDVGELVDLLAERRRAQGLSQSEIADRMGTSQPAVARLEAGQGDVRLSTLRRYAEALGQTLHFAVASPPDATQTP